LHRTGAGQGKPCRRAGIEAGAKRRLTEECDAGREKIAEAKGLICMKINCPFFELFALQ
jgi:hypothetical protein